MQELLTVAQEFDNESADKSLSEFLQNISLSSDTDELQDQNDMITLMTLHSAKGLEYKAVFLVGLEEGIFPSYLSIGDENQIEEERRLFYVGITRAKENLFMSFAKRRTIFGSTSYNPPSRFLNEIPAELLEGYEDAMAAKHNEDTFDDEDSFSWKYGKSNVVSFNRESREAKSSFLNGGVISYRDKPVVEKKAYAQTPFKSAESFLKNLEAKKKADIDISQYKVGQKISHKKFGVGLITKLEEEGDDLKVDIDFENFGHKRLMARFAGLEIL